MSNLALRPARTKSLQLVCVPVGLVVILVFALLIFSDRVAGYSVLLGGAVWFFPNLFFVYQVFTKVGTANTIVRRFYRAEFTKLFLSAVLFIFAIKFFSVNMLAFLLGFSSAQLMFWVTPLVKSGMLRL